MFRFVVLARSSYGVLRFVRHPVQFNLRCGFTITALVTTHILIAKNAAANLRSWFAFVQDGADERQYAAVERSSVLRTVEKELDLGNCEVVTAFIQSFPTTHRPSTKFGRVRGRQRSSAPKHRPAQPLPLALPRA